jgi:hypothetical protein
VQAFGLLRKVFVENGLGWQVQMQWR